MCVSMCMLENIYMQGKLPAEVRRGHQIRWSWNYR